MKEINRGDSRKGEYLDVSNETKERRKLTWTLAGVGTVLLILILFFALSGDSDYERGQKYLKQKQYTEALVEFQQVEPGDKDFRMAQSKINYINGLRAYNDNMKTEAKVYLLRVDPTDEYYNEARLMIEKIDLANKNENMEQLSGALTGSKDTMIIREKIIDTSGQKVSEAGTSTKSNIENKNKIYILNLEKLVKDFESHYLIARAKADTKKEYVMDSLYNKFLMLESSELNPASAELKELTSTYMQKRIDYIKKQLEENSNKESDELRYLKEDGDKIYNKVITQINKVN